MAKKQPSSGAQDQKNDKKQEELSQMDKLRKEFIELVKALAWALVVAGLIRSFIFEPFTIPSGSMIPTLLVGDYIYVDKFSYGYSRWSFPFGMPPFSGRFAFSEPKQGDIVVFKAPKPGDDKYYVKRLIGLPGQTVQMKGGRLYIDDTIVPIELEGQYTYIDEDSLQQLSTKRFIETLPNGVRHFMLKGVPFGESRYDNTMPFKVADQTYFMMGDNRDFSSDSRNRFHMGDIPQEKLIGKALFIFFSTSAKWYQVVKWFSSIRYERLFKGLYNLSWQKKLNNL